MTRQLVFFDTELHELHKLELDEDEVERTLEENPEWIRLPVVPKAEFAT